MARDALMLQWAESKQTHHQRSGAYNAPASTHANDPNRIVVTASRPPGRHLKSQLEYNLKIPLFVNYSSQGTPSRPNMP